VRVVIAEDSVLLREGLVRLLTEYDHEVVATLGDAHHLVDTVTRLEPDLTIVDVRMPPTSTDEGLRAAVLMLSQYVEERYARELVTTGAEGVGYLLKERVADVAEFVAAAERVAAGGTVFDPEVIAQLVVRSPRRSRLDTLTPREREVLDRMAQGRSNTAIARDLVVSDGAVEKHISSIFAKLGLGPDDTGHRRVLAVLAFLHDA
jgi:DNA-binding NarL/FixJ family response regulator